MQKDFVILKEKFQDIRRKGLIKSLRKGNSGAGYTFETLLGKSEDQLCKPDFGCVEIKTRMTYSKYPLKLFHCEPKRKKSPAIKYIFDTYCYPKYKDKNLLVFDRELFANKAKKRCHYEFKLDVDFLHQLIIMKSYYEGNFVEDVCYWDFKTLERKLKTKLTYLAIIQLYPYKIKGEIYYKYVKINFYKLKGFFEFLQLIKSGKISISIYLKRNKDSIDVPIDNHGFSFRIEYDALEKLFYKYKY